MQLFRPGSIAAGLLATLDLTATGDQSAAEDLLAAALAWPSQQAGVEQGDQAQPERWTVRANMIASLDGGATVDGTSGGLGTPIDQKLIGLQRDLADAVMVGAGTVIGEHYPGAKAYPKRTRRRERWCRSAIPPWVIVASHPLPTDLPAITDSAVPPFVVTIDEVDQPDGVTVIRTGPMLDLGNALEQLADHGCHRILCEGGPTLLGRLAAANLLDELSLTIAPALLGTGTTTPLLGGTDLLCGTEALGGTDQEQPRWRLVTLLADGDHLFTGYRRER
ncbi:MAG: dihydrofolate reductase family protein [Actinomycetota bacterium]|nr:dihydrofolate reductase family protein [Actinomycetota bacterium]